MTGKICILIICAVAIIVTGVVSLSSAKGITIVVWNIVILFIYTVNTCVIVITTVVNLSFLLRIDITIAVIITVDSVSIGGVIPSHIDILIRMSRTVITTITLN